MLRRVASCPLPNVRARGIRRIVVERIDPRPVVVVLDLLVLGIPVVILSELELAALTLLAVSLWLMRTKRPVLFALLPMFFMLLISGWALVILIMQNINKNWSLVLIAAFLLVMACGLLLLSFKKMKETKAAQKQA